MKRKHNTVMSDSGSDYDKMALDQSLHVYRVHKAKSSGLKSNYSFNDNTTIEKRKSSKRNSQNVG